MIARIFIFILFLSYQTVAQNFYSDLSNCALELTQDNVTYDPSYFSIPYPNGDVPKGKGVCTDVVIRAYRKMGVDLQKEVHLDMKTNFNAYPKLWNLKHTDTNIDHRRVPNLMCFFKRQQSALPITQNAKDYKPGDIVAWNLGGAITHIGMVSSKKTTDQKRFLIIHNIGSGQVVEDVLFAYKIIGHYRYKKR